MKVAILLFTSAAILLAIFGLVMIYSVSSVQGEALNNDGYHFVKNQGLFLVLAITVAILINLIPFDSFFSKGIIYFAGISILIGLIIVHIPGIGREVNGSNRWIDFLGFRLQTSEFIKLATIFLMAWWQGQPWRKNKSLLEGLIIPSAVLLVIDAGLMLQPDFGSTLMLSTICFLMMIVAGVKIKYFLCLIPFPIIAFVMKVIADPLRLKRVTPIFELNFADSVDQEILSDSLYQVISAISAFKHGGAWGQGIGQSVFKEHYIPEYHTDFILSMVGEELGILGTSLVAIGVLIILICGTYISIKENDFQFRLLAFGMTLQISLYSIVNTGVVSGLFPTKGLAMPFLSYGGSNLLSTFIAAGLVIYVARHVMENEYQEGTPAHDPNFWKM
ncbi:MAG: cell division protein FtsW [Kiritimatiellae bacterium]|nr:cell division protein FtsW [Kiritimatiellia bacterium]